MKDRIRKVTATLILHILPLLYLVYSSNLLDSSRSNGLGHTRGYNEKWSALELLLFPLLATILSTSLIDWWLLRLLDGRWRAGVITCQCVLIGLGAAWGLQAI